MVRVKTPTPANLYIPEMDMNISGEDEETFIEIDAGVPTLSTSSPACVKLNLSRAIDLAEEKDDGEEAAMVRKVRTRAGDLPSTTYVHKNVAHLKYSQPAHYMI